MAGSVAAHTTSSSVRWVAGPTASSIGLIGDSTLSGVRWMDRYGDLERFNFLFDAESCRRTVERSCWSREQYRPPTALEALQRHEGEWGDVLVVMTGYNDSSTGFADGVETIVAEARRQGIGSVVWLSLRTKGVDYEEPLHLANGSTYRDANRSLYELAEESDGYLQIADWAGYSADRPDWFESDGAHLAGGGVDAVTEFIAAQVEVVLGGGSVTPVPAPWEEIRPGDQGPLVAEVQEALVAAGVYDRAHVDAAFGPMTQDAVASYQRGMGLVANGVVDQATAVALGLAAADRDATATTVSVPSPANSAGTDDVTGASTGGGLDAGLIQLPDEPAPAGGAATVSSGSGVDRDWIVAGGVLVLSVAAVMRRRRHRGLDLVGSQVVGSADSDVQAERDLHPDEIEQRT